MPRNLSFRGGLPYFERTLGLFRGLGRGNLAKVPSAYVTIVADHAERALAQFERDSALHRRGSRESFEVRNHLIAEVRDYYRELHDDVSILVTRPPGQQEHPTRAPWYMGAPLAVIMLRDVRRRCDRRVPLRTVRLRGAGPDRFAARHRAPYSHIRCSAGVCRCLRSLAATA